MKIKNSVFLLLLFIGMSLSAQDYSKQVTAFKESFDAKTIDKVKPHLSSELKFKPLPVSNTLPILTNIVSKLPTLHSLTLLKNEEGKAKVKYDFAMLGERESYIFFDKEGKIIQIELVENLIKEEMDAQKALRDAAPKPNPGVLATKFPFEEVEIETKDGLKISGSLYQVDKKKPIILLCHQAGYNKEEYIDIAPRLNALGYNCLTIDQRSGGDFGGKSNVTKQRAERKKMSIGMYDAREDLITAIAYLSKKYNQKVIVWGSSYSSSLSLIEGQKNTNVKAIIAFSPGDYFGNKTASLSTVFADIDKPYFVTSSKQESIALKALIGTSKVKENQIQFVPTANGFHGSKAVWIDQEGKEEYWNAVTNFLKNINSK